MSIYDNNKIKRITLTNRRDYKGWEVTIIEQVEDSTLEQRLSLGYFHEHETGFVIGEACTEYVKGNSDIQPHTITGLSNVINVMLGEPEE